MQARSKQSMGKLLPMSQTSFDKVTDLCRAINLTKNSQFFVRQADVQTLINQGFLQRLS
jgi:hypothetical protein